MLTPNEFAAALLLAAVAVMTVYWLGCVWLNRRRSRQRGEETMNGWLRRLEKLEAIAAEKIGSYPWYRDICKRLGDLEKQNVEHADRMVEADEHAIAQVAETNRIMHRLNDVERQLVVLAGTRPGDRIKALESNYDGLAVRLGERIAKLESQVETHHNTLANVAQLAPAVGNLRDEMAKMSNHHAEHVEVVNSLQAEFVELQNSGATISHAKELESLRQEVAAINRRMAELTLKVLSIVQNGLAVKQVDLPPEGPTATEPPTKPLDAPPAKMPVTGDSWQPKSFDVTMGDADVWAKVAKAIMGAGQ